MTKKMRTNTKRDTAKPKQASQGRKVHVEDRGAAQETDVFGYSNMLDAFQDMMCGCSEYAGGDAWNGDWQSKMQDAMHNSMPKSGGAQKRNLQELASVLQTNVNHVMDETRGWFQDSTRNAAGLMKNIMKSSDTQGKLDSIHEYLLSQLGANVRAGRGRIDARYNVISALTAAFEGRNTDWARSAQKAFMGH